MIALRCITATYSEFYQMRILSCYSELILSTLSTFGQKNRADLHYRAICHSLR